MFLATASLKSLTPYSPSKRLQSPRKENEAWEDYEQRVWRERIHRNAENFVFIPQMAFKRSLETSAKYMSLKIPGEGQAKWTKHFLSGVLVPESLVLPIKVDDVECEPLYLSSRGIRGQTDVLKYEPKIEEWAGDVTYYVLDPKITQDVFEKMLAGAGSFIGVGRFRPEMGGFYGRYAVEKIVWTES